MKLPWKELGVKSKQIETFEDEYGNIMVERYENSAIDQRIVLRIFVFSTLSGTERVKLRLKLVISKILFIIINSFQIFMQISSGVNGDQRVYNEPDGVKQPNLWPPVGE